MSKTVTDIAITLFSMMQNHSLFEPHLIKNIIAKVIKLDNIDSSEVIREGTSVLEFMYTRWNERIFMLAETRPNFKWLVERMPFNGYPREADSISNEEIFDHYIFRKQKLYEYEGILWWATENYAKKYKYEKEACLDDPRVQLALMNLIWSDF